MGIPTSKDFILGGSVEPFRVLQLSAGKAIHTTAPTQAPVCFSQGQAGGEGDHLDCAMRGVIKLTAGEAIAKGALVMADADGKIITWATGAGRFIVGRALEAASGDNHRIEVDANPSFIADA